MVPGSVSPSQERGFGTLRAVAYPDLDFFVDLWPKELLAKLNIIGFFADHIALAGATAESQQPDQFGPSDSRQFFQTKVELRHFREVPHHEANCTGSK